MHFSGHRRCVQSFVVAALGTLLCGSPVSAQQEPQRPIPQVADSARVQNPFADVPTSSWAYQAIQKLVAEKLIEGFPDGQVKGDRPLSRYEMAVIVARLSSTIEARLSSTNVGSVSASDIAAMKQLVDEFQPELAKLVALEKRDPVLDKQVAKNTEALTRQQIHVTYFLRAPGLFSDTVTAYNGRGALSAANGQLANVAAHGALPTGLPFTTGEMPGLIGQNSSTSGGINHGTGYQVARLAFGGTFDKYFSYGLRLENREFFDNPQGSTTTSTPNYCTSAACSPVFVAASSAPVRLNYSWLKYTSPSSIYVQVGSFFGNEAKGLGLSYTNYIDGVQVGYAPAKSKLNVEAGYGFGVASGSNTIPGFQNQSQQQLFGHADYDVTPRLNLGGAYMRQIAMSAILWNPSAPLAYTAGPKKGQTIVDAAGLPITGAYLPAQGTINVASVYGSYQFGTNFNLAFEALHRYGNDIFTGRPWAQPNALWIEGVLGEQHGGRGINGVQSGGRPGSNYLLFGYIASGFNSTGAYENITSTASYRALYINAPNGYQSYYAGIHHWIGANARVGLFWQNFGLLPGTVMPAGSAVCPGCYLASDTKNAVVLESLFQF